MNNNIIANYSNYVHDNDVLSYSVNFEKTELIINTKYLDKTNTQVKFTELLAHKFDAPMNNSIISGLFQFSIDNFINNNIQSLEEWLNCAFPIYLPCGHDQKAQRFKNLKDYLIKNDYKYFDLQDAIGLSGFILAKDISFDTTIISKK